MVHPLGKLGFLLRPLDSTVGEGTPPVKMTELKNTVAPWRKGKG